LDRPVTRKGPFDAGAGGPAGPGVAGGSSEISEGGRNADVGGRRPRAAIGEAGCAVEQDVISGYAKTATKRSKPVDMVASGRVGRNEATTAGKGHKGCAPNIGAINVGLDTEKPFAELAVVTELAAAKSPFVLG